MQSLMSFISGQPSVQGEEGEVPNQSNEIVEFGWNMIKVNARPSQANNLVQGEMVQAAAAAG